MLSTIAALAMSLIGSGSAPKDAEIVVSTGESVQFFNARTLKVDGYYHGDHLWISPGAAFRKGNAIYLISNEGFRLTFKVDKDQHITFESSKEEPRLKPFNLSLGLAISQDGSRMFGIVDQKGIGSLETGKKAMRVIHPLPPSIEAYFPSISKDGRYLAYSLYDNKMQADHEGERYRLRVLDLVSKKVFSVGEGASACWSQDSNSLLVRHGDNLAGMSWSEYEFSGKRFKERRWADLENEASSLAYWDDGVVALGYIGPKHTYGLVFYKKDGTLYRKLPIPDADSGSTVAVIDGE
ncbi:MAG: hypothetical protein JSS72_03235 [Armatimonadetes bacterium]|nr:hypothetical protein [Armatimonadota bacterium]